MVNPSSNTYWCSANDWVGELGEDWRMPKVDELGGLWQAGITL